MLWTLINTGHLPAWDWLWMAIIWTVILGGTSALAVIWRTRPPK